MTTAFIAGFLLGLSLILAIGAQNAFVLRQGLRREHVFAVALVCALSDAVLIAGGVAVVAMWRLSGTGDFLGLGVPLLTRSFTDAQLPVAVFALKLVFTAVTLGAGFPGGEVTPLFVIGAALGNVLARALGMPIALGAGVGLAAVFAAASNTPLALTIMAAELLGAAALPHTALVCVLAYVLTGHRSIYPSQRLLRTKAGRALPAPTRVRELADDELR